MRRVNVGVYSDVESNKYPQYISYVTIRDFASRHERRAIQYKHCTSIYMRLSRGSVSYVLQKTHVENSTGRSCTEYHLKLDIATV